MRTMNRMSLKLITVCGLAFHLTGFAAMTATAKDTSPVPLPVITFKPGTSTVQKSVGVVLVTAAVGTYPTGIKSLAFSGGYSGSTAYYSANKGGVKTTLYFYCGYFPAGAYKFTATATGFNGKSTTQSMTLTTK